MTTSLHENDKKGSSIREKLSYRMHMIEDQINNGTLQDLHLFRKYLFTAGKIVNMNGQEENERLVTETIPEQRMQIQERVKYWFEQAKKYRNVSDGDYSELSYFCMEEGYGRLEKVQALRTEGNSEAADKTYKEALNWQKLSLRFNLIDMRINLYGEYNSPEINLEELANEEELAIKALRTRLQNSIKDTTYNLDVRISTLDGHFYFKIPTHDNGVAGIWEYYKGNLSRIRNSHQILPSYMQ